MPFSIRPIIVGRASVKTPIWEKESSVNIPDIVKKSIFEKYFINFQKLMLDTAKDSLDPAWLAKNIVRISEKKNPKVRYAFAQKYFLEWFLPHYLLSYNMLDNALLKAMSKN